MLYEGIKEAQACYAKLQLAQMDESYLSNPLNQAYPAQWRNRQYGSTSKGLSSQYYGSHELLEANQTTGCLFSNLLAILMIKKENVSLSMLRNLKQAIADSLDDPTLAKEFEERIKSNYSQGSKIKTVSDYQKWLRGDSQFTIDQCSEIEIELTARLVGIKIGVFVLNRPTELDAQGLMIPSGPESYFGPNTQERYYLYNHTGMSYYGLFPIYKSSLSFWSLNDLVGDVEAAEIREAINTSHTYWLSLRRANEN
jgi:hypothetical protein